jgi:nucleotide-binding universal stress UspA family protein
MMRESKYYSFYIFNVYTFCVYRTILLPVDDSEQSYAAVELAGILSCGCGATLTLFHVRKPPREVVTDMVTEDKLFALPLMEKERAMFTRCKEILRPFHSDPQVKLVESEMIAGEIIKECRSGNYDAIIMGHRGRKALRQLLLGSVANGVLVEAECPVIMAHMPPRNE